MDATVVLIANEPQVYREVLAAALQDMRPSMEIAVVVRFARDAEVLLRCGYRCPQLVIYGQIAPIVMIHVWMWIQYDPVNTSDVIVSIDGKAIHSSTDIVDLQFFLDRLDEAAQRSWHR